MMNMFHRRCFFFSPLVSRDDTSSPLQETHLCSSTFTIKHYSCSQILRVPGTTWLCWGLYDSNYIICPICYCFIHVRIICFGFLCNVLGFASAPWDVCYTVSGLDRLFIKSPLLLSSWLSNHDAQTKCTAPFQRRSQEDGSDHGEDLFTCSINWVRVKSVRRRRRWRGDGLTEDKEEAVIITQHLLYNDSFISPSVAIPLLINLIIAANSRTVSG